MAVIDGVSVCDVSEAQLLLAVDDARLADAGVDDCDCGPELAGLEPPP